MPGQSSSRKAYYFPGGMPRSILKLEESSNFNGYPAHIQELLKSPSGVISTREFLSRLLHVCLVEVGFLPVANLEEDEEIIELEGDGSSPFYSQIVNSDYCDSVPRCVLALAKVLKDGGTLQQWKYRAVVMQRWKKDGATLESTSGKVRDEDGSQSSSNSSLFEEPVGTWKERKVISSPISITIMFDNLDMIVLEKNTELFREPVQTFVRTKKTCQPQATPGNFMELFDFLPTSFVRIITNGVCNKVLEMIGLPVVSFSNSPLFRLSSLSKGCVEMIPPDIKDLIVNCGSITAGEMIERFVHLIFIETGFIPLQYKNETLDFDLLEDPIEDRLMRLARKLSKMLKASGNTTSSQPKCIGSISYKTTVESDFEPSPKKMKTLTKNSHYVFSKLITVSCDVQKTAVFLKVVSDVVAESFRIESELAKFHDLKLDLNYILNSRSLFNIIQFIDDIKWKICFPLMEKLESLSAETRSLAWFPNEILVAIALKCNTREILTLKHTCVKMRAVLGSNNAQFWKKIIIRDYPAYPLNENVNRIHVDGTETRYFAKFLELCDYAFPPDVE